MEENTDGFNNPAVSLHNETTFPAAAACRDSSHSRLRSQIIFLTGVRIVPGISERMVYPFLTVFARGMEVGLPAISWAISFRAFIGIFSPILVAALDQYGRKLGLLLGLGLVILSSALMTVFPTYPVFFLFLCLCFIGALIIVTSQQAFIGDQIPYLQRGRVIGLVETSWAISFIAGMPVIALLINFWGWKAPFPFLTLLGIIFFILICRTMPGGVNENVSPGMNNFLHNLRNVVKHSSARAALFYAVFLISANECIGLIFGVWIADSIGSWDAGILDLKVAALGAASVVIGIAELVGELLSGGFVDRFGKERSIKAGVVLNACIALLLPWLGGSLWGAYLGLFLFYLTFEFSVVAGITLITEILPAVRGTLLGLTNGAASMGRMSGALLASYLYAFGFQFNAWGVVLLNLACLLALSKIRLSDQKPEELLQTGI